MISSDAVESRWQSNERRLTAIHAMTGLGRELHGAEIERLEAEQDAIEHDLGCDVRRRSRRWSGAR
jgi:hypothetical protein